MNFLPLPLDLGRLLGALHLGEFVFLFGEFLGLGVSGRQRQIAHLRLERKHVVEEELDEFSDEALQRLAFQQLFVFLVDFGEIQFAFSADLQLNRGSNEEVEQRESLESFGDVVFFLKEVAETEKNVFVEVFGRRVLIKSQTHLDHELVQKARVSLHSHDFLKPVVHLPVSSNAFQREKVVEDLFAGAQELECRLLAFFLPIRTFDEYSRICLQTGKIEESLDEQVLLLLGKLFLLLKQFPVFQALLELLMEEVEFHKLHFDRGP